MTSRFAPISEEKRAGILADLRGTEDSSKIIAIRHGVALSTVSDLIQRNGLTGRKVSFVRPKPLHSMPEGFAADARCMTDTELKAKYRIGDPKIKRFRAEAGAYMDWSLKKDARKASSQKAVQTRWGDRAKPERITVKRPPPRPAASPKRAFEQPQRDMSPTGIAADYLKRFTAVIRCDINGRPLPDGFFWRYGRVVLTDEQLIERAEETREREARRAAQYRVAGGLAEGRA